MSRAPQSTPPSNTKSSSSTVSPPTQSVVGIAEKFDKSVDEDAEKAIVFDDVLATAKQSKELQL